MSIRANFYPSASLDGFCKATLALHNRLFDDVGGADCREAARELAQLTGDSLADWVDTAGALAEEGFLGSNIWLALNLTRAIHQLATQNAVDLAQAVGALQRLEPYFTKMDLDAINAARLNELCGNKDVDLLKVSVFIRSFLGDVDGAVREMREILQISTDTRTKLAVYYGLGSVLQEASRHAEAIVAFQEAFDLSKAPGFDRHWIAPVVEKLVPSLWIEDRTLEAEIVAMDALAFLDDFGDDAKVAAFLSSFELLMAINGNQEMSVPVRDPRHPLPTRASFGELALITRFHVISGRLAEAELGVARLKDADVSPSHSAQIEVLEAEILIARKEYSVALKKLHDAASRFETQCPTSFLLSKIFMWEARCLIAMNDYDGGVQAFRKSISVLETVSPQCFSLVVRRAQLGVLAQSEGDMDVVNEALSPAWPQLESLLQRLTDKALIHFLQYTEFILPPLVEMLAFSHRIVDAFRFADATKDWKTRRDFGGAGSSESPPQVSAETLATFLSETSDRIFISYTVCWGWVWTIALSREGFYVSKWMPAGTGLVDFDRSFRNHDWSGVLRGYPDSKADFLLPEPLLDLIRKANHVVICPDSCMWGVPWRALKATGMEQPLGLMKPISLVTSARMYEQLKDRERLKKGGGEALVFGFSFKDAAGGLDLNDRATILPIPNAEVEAGQVAQIYGVEPIVQPGQATVIWNRMATAGMVHGVTHGLFNADNPLKSGILIPGKTPNELILLTAASFAQSDLQARLIVFSACDSGRALGDRGAGLRGMAYSMSKSNVSAFVAAPWPVPDKETSQLMVEFHRNLKSGQSVAGALMLASRKIASQPGHMVADWACFTVFGLGDILI